MLETPERNGHFDIYLLDIPMPELDRLSVGRLLMRTKEGKQTISFYQIISRGCLPRNTAGAFLPSIHKT